ncbi:MAG: M20/M25/M40 family metallo-hydrolase [Bacteroidota bacterium]
MTTRINTDSKSPIWVRALYTAILILAGWFGLAGFSSPDTNSSASVDSAFELERALAHLTAIASEPRPVGSRAHVETQQYLARELETAGFEVGLQRADVNEPRLGIHFARVHNVAGRLRGTGDGTAIALVSHYDSVPGSPGAADNGAAVAALLEVARVLSNGPDLAHDIVLLFTDAEEVGLLGAKAFMLEHPWATDVEVALNFDARGGSGPSIMFETSQNNSALVSTFASGSEHPVASSLTQSLYEMMPNDTDLSVFKAFEVAGLNFAFIEDEPHYHSALDVIENLDPQSLYHHGKNALDVVYALNTSSLSSQSLEASSGNALYFSLPFGLFIHVPMWGGLIASLVGLAAMGYLLVLGTRKGTWEVKALAKSFAAVTTSLGLSIGLAYGCWFVSERLIYDYARVGDQMPRLVAACMAIGAGIGPMLMARAINKIKPATVLASLLCLWGLVTMALLIWLPGGVYLGLLPLYPGLALLALLIARPPAKSPTPLHTGAWAALVGLSALSVLPILGLVVHGLSPSLAVGGTLLGALVFATAIFTAKDHLPVGVYGVSGVLTVGALAIAGLVIGSAEYTAERPASNEVFYAYDTNTNAAAWLTRDAGLDGWTSQFFDGQGPRTPLSDLLPWSSFEYLRQPADSVDWSPPTAVLTGTDTTSQGRTLRYTVASPARAERTLIYVRFDGIIESMTINGNEFPSEELLVSSAGTTWRGAMCYAIPPGGIDVEVSVVRQLREAEGSSATPVLLSVTDVHGRLPLASLNKPERPAHLMPYRFQPFTDVSFVHYSLQR